MNAIRILGLCVAAAMVCSAIRMQNPQIATAVAIGSGAAAVLLSMSDFHAIVGQLQRLSALDWMNGEEFTYLLKLCAVSLLGEFASDICIDCGERALANRISFGVRAAMLASALPMAGEIMLRISELTA